MSGLKAAVTLLTRIPMGGADWDRGDLSRSVKWVPVVGGLIGLVVALAYAGLVSVMPATLAAGLAVAVGMLFTGALHEDGLADTVDGFAGGSDSEDRLRIMKDPVHGTYGALALVLSVVVRVAALAAMGSVPALFLLPAVHAVSRGGAVALMGALPPASSEGLGAAHSDPGLRRQVLIGVLFAILIGLVTLGWWLVPFAVLAVAGTIVIGFLARRLISGYTGDVLGAAQQVGEILLMVLGASMVSSGLIVSVWWR
ncbi:MAG: adenosylcobinamide-GDP ribazoletransferase [Acidimicrobiia bacterium]